MPFRHVDACVPACHARSAMRLQLTQSMQLTGAAAAATGAAPSSVASHSCRRCWTRLTLACCVLASTNLSSLQTSVWCLHPPSSRPLGESLLQALLYYGRSRWSLSSWPSPSAICLLLWIQSPRNNLTDIWSRRQTPGSWCQDHDAFVLCM